MITPWAASRHRYDAGLGLRSLEDIETLIAFFEARQGELFGFRWKDWSDYKSCAAGSDPAYDDQVIGTGDGIETDFVLKKTYRSGTAEYVRDILKPVLGTVRVEGVQVTAGFEFDVPVRFDTDRIMTSVASFQAGDAPAVPVVEVRI